MSVHQSRLYWEEQNYKKYNLIVKQGSFEQIFEKFNPLDYLTDICEFGHRQMSYINSDICFEKFEVINKQGQLPSTHYIMLINYSPFNSSQANFKYFLLKNEGQKGCLVKVNFQKLNEDKTQISIEDQQLFFKKLLQEKQKNSALTRGQYSQVSEPMTQMKMEKVIQKVSQIIIPKVAPTQNEMQKYIGHILQNLKYLDDFLDQKEQSEENILKIGSYIKMLLEQFCFYSLFQQIESDLTNKYFYWYLVKTNLMKKPKLFKNSNIKNDIRLLKILINNAKEYLQKAMSGMQEQFQKQKEIVNNVIPIICQKHFKYIKGVQQEIEKTKTSSWLDQKKLAKLLQLKKCSYALTFQEIQTIANEIQISEPVIENKSQFQMQISDSTEAQQSFKCDICKNQNLYLDQGSGICKTCKKNSILLKCTSEQCDGQFCIECKFILRKDEKHNVYCPFNHKIEKAEENFEHFEKNCEVSFVCCDSCGFVPSTAYKDTQCGLDLCQLCYITKQ